MPPAPTSRKSIARKSLAASHQRAASKSWLNLRNNNKSKVQGAKYHLIQVVQSPTFRLSWRRQPQTKVCTLNYLRDTFHLLTLDIGRWTLDSMSQIPEKVVALST